MQCIDPTTVTIQAGVNRNECLSPWIWTNPPGFGSFDNIFSAFLVMFELSTEENWPVTMYNYIDATPPGLAHVVDYNQFVSIYFIIAVTVTSLFVKDLFVGSVLNGYASQHSEITGAVDLSDAQNDWVEIYRLCVENPPSVRPVPPVKGNNYRSLHLFRLQVCALFCITFFLI